MNFSDLIADEPAYVLDPSAVVRAGKRRRARRLALVSGTTAVTIAAAALALTWGGAGSTPSSTLRPAASATPASEVTDDRWTAIVRAHTPAAWTIDVLESSDTGWSANVDDGRGAGRLYFGLSPHPGSLQQHPCGDPEFVQGGKCEERELGDGRRLIVREAQPSGDFRSVVAVVVHRDGGGIDIGNDNATFPEVPKGTVSASAEDKIAGTRGTVTRPLPLYGAQMLAEIAQALDASQA